MLVLTTAVLCEVARAAEAPPAPTVAPAPGATPSTTIQGDVPNAIDALAPPTSHDAHPAASESGGVANNDLGNRISRAALMVKSHEFADAVPQLQAIIDDLEHQTSRYDPSLVIPLTLLGDAYNGDGKYKEALRTYEQGEHISRVTEGLHTASQVDLVYREAATLAAMGELDKANDREEYAYETLVRAYGPFSPSLIPGLYKLAAWYERTSNIFSARGLYERAVDIISRTGGGTDPALVPALRGLATTYREERFPPYETAEPRAPSMSTDLTAMPTVMGAPPTVVNRFGPGEAALSQIVKIVNADAAATPLDRVKAELDLADWYLMFDKAARATTVYVHARQQMREKVGMSEDQIATYFQPTILYRPIPDGPPLPPPALRINPTEGHVELSFTVTEDGEVGELKTLSSDPEGMMDIKVRRGMRAARFRPRFEGDTPVATPNQVYRHTFVYYPHPEPPAAGSKPDGSTAGEAKQDGSKADVTASAAG
jgi:TonB family protein